MNPAQNTRPKPLLIAIMGPTASGKTELAEALAERLDAQLLNADAFQVYRGMDIGTNKPSRKELYKLLDLKEPSEGFGVGEWVQLAQEELHKLWQVQKSAVVVGGTGFYIRALFEEYADLKPAPDPELREQLLRREKEEGLEPLIEQLKALDPILVKNIDIDNPVRVRRALERALTPTMPLQPSLPPFIQIKFGIDAPTSILNPFIEERARNLLQQGWKEEVAEILGRGVQKSAPGLRAIGYHAVIDWLEGRAGFDIALEIIQHQTKAYAKRQRTWLRSEPGLLWIKRSDAGRMGDEVWAHLEPALKGG